MRYSVLFLLAIAIELGPAGVNIIEEVLHTNGASLNVSFED